MTDQSRSHRPDQRTSHSASEAGFTVIEVVIAAAMSLVLGVAIVTIVASSMEMTATMQANGSVSARAEAALTAFARVARDADKVVTATADTLVVNYRTQNRCERHTYQLVADPDRPARRALQHQILAFTVQGTTTCANVDPSLTSGQTPQTQRVELADLSPESRFDYYANTGQRTLRLGDDGFNPAENLPACQLGSVQLTVYSPIYPADANADQEDTIRVAFRNNARGLTC